MKTYELPELLRRWEYGKLTAEQMIGHLLQHIAALAKRVEALENRPSCSSSPDSE